MLDDLAKVAADYNMAQLMVVNVPDAGKVVLSTHGQVEDGFLDPRSKKTFQVEHMNLVRFPPFLLYILDK
jgi:hypothetical protein